MSGKPFMNRSAEGDFYETPYSMTRSVLEVEYWNRSREVLEPAQGNGAITRVLKENFQTVRAYDLETDFLKESGKFPYIITNPPYRQADEFVEKCWSVSTEKFALLLRTNFLSGQKRYHAGRYKGLARVYVFTWMADLRSPIREDGKYPTAGIVYAWFVWDKTYYKTGTELRWIDNSGFVLKKKDSGIPSGPDEC